jgi:hypothetical protein
MAFKDKVWIFCLIGAIVVIIGYFTPYVSFMGLMQLWLFGFAITPYGGYMIPWEGDFLLLAMLGVIVVAVAGIALIISILMKVKEDSKVMKILAIIFGVVILVLTIIPPLVVSGYMAMLINFANAAIGFYLMLIGGIVLMLFGILGLALR